MNSEPQGDFERLQAEDTQQERRLLWAELSVLVVVALAAGCYAWFN